MKATDYITLVEAKQHLAVDASYKGDDLLIENYLDNALYIVLSESCNSIEDVIDADGALNKVTKQATLLFVKATIQGRLIKFMAATTA